MALQRGDENGESGHWQIPSLLYVVTDAEAGRAFEGSKSWLGGQT